MISLIQTAEGALSETHSILQRMRELAVQSANDTNTDTDRAEIQKEVNQLAKEITRVANDTQFNTQNLLNGGIQTGNRGTLTFQIGANEGQSISIEIDAMDAASLGVAGNDIIASPSNATDVNSATIEGIAGDALVSGASLTLSAASNDAGSTATTGGVGGITLTTQSSTDELNGITIKYVDGGDSQTTVATAWDADSKTITVTGDFANNDTGASGYSTGAEIATAINSELTTQGFSAQVSGTGTASASTAGKTATFTGGENATLDITVSNGTLTETVTVENNATSVSFTDDSKFAGLTVSLDGSLSTSTYADISIGGQFSHAATFSGGEKTSDAVAYGGINVSTQDSADDAITIINDAIQEVSSQRSELGAYQNRLEHTINNLSTSAQNLTAAESRIRDVDYAEAA